jgi:hypothetical protein
MMLLVLLSAAFVCAAPHNSRYGQSAKSPYYQQNGYQTCQTTAQQNYSRVEAELQALRQSDSQLSGQSDSNAQQTQQAQMQYQNDIQACQLQANVWTGGWGHSPNGGNWADWCKGNSNCQGGYPYGIPYQY